MNIQVTRKEVGNQLLSNNNKRSQTFHNKDKKKNGLPSQLVLATAVRLGKTQ